MSRLNTPLEWAEIFYLAPQKDLNTGVNKITSRNAKVAKLSSSMTTRGRLASSRKETIPTKNNPYVAADNVPDD